MGHAASAPVAMHSGGVAMSRAAGVRAVASSGLRATSSRPAMVSHVRVSNGVIHVVRRNPSTVRTVVAHSQNFIDDANAVPGLGFDFVHFAAVHPNAFHRHRINLGGFFPFFSGGFVMPSVPVVVDEESAPESEEVVAEDAPRRRVHMVASEPPPVATEVAAAAGPTDEYVFVRRDGTVFFAVAYSWENGALRYITSQGLRGTVTRDTLDLNATQQFNDQRGLSFHSPA